MRIAVLLADSAQSEPGGKVHALGIGWTRTSSPTAPMAIIVQIEFEGVQVEVGDYKLEVRLVDADGELADVDGKNASFSADVHYEMADDVPGPELASFVINMAPGVPLPPDRRYQWRVYIDGKTQPDWAAGFRTRPTDTTGDEPAQPGLTSDR